MVNFTDLKPLYDHLEKNARDYKYLYSFLENLESSFTNSLLTLPFTGASRQYTIYMVLSPILIGIVLSDNLYSFLIDQAEYLELLYDPTRRLRAAVELLLRL